MSRAEAVSVPGRVRGEERQVELLGVGFGEVFALDGGVLVVEICGAGEVCAWGEGAGCEDEGEEGEGVGGGC